MLNGFSFIRFCSLRFVLRAGLVTMIASLLRLFSGGDVLVFPGVIFILISGLGKLSSTVLIVGPNVADGTFSLRNFKQTLTSNGTASTAPQTVRINTHLVEKGGPNSGHWPLPRRPDNEGSFGG
jgi:hypothetical protein